MVSYPMFLSVVYVVRNQGGNLKEMLHDAVTHLTSLVSDFELIVSYRQ